MNDLDRKTKAEARLIELKKLSDAELKARFWELCNKSVEPLFDLAKTHTSPSIERSVLMRMGLDSVTAKAVVNKCMEQNLLSKGAGHVLYKLAEKNHHGNLQKAAKEIVESKEIPTDLIK